MTATVSISHLGYTSSTLQESPFELRVRPGGRPWLPYKSLPIRAKGNNKTNPTPQGKEWGRKNVVELGILVASVRGCGGAHLFSGRGCFGDCYSYESTARYHIKYWIPVPQILNTRVLAKDLLALRGELVRDGNEGDPSYAWNVAVNLAEFCSYFEKTYIGVTRFWNSPDDYVLERFADVDAVLHGSISAIDPERHRRKILRNLERYENMGGRIVHRVVTMPFRTELERLWGIQDDLMSLKNVLQQPLRVRGTNPLMHLFDKDLLGPTIAHTDGRLTNRWRSAGDLYGSRGCFSECYRCWNGCMSNPGAWKGSVST